MDNLWNDKNAFSSVKSLEKVSIQDTNRCSYKRFMLSTKSTLDENTILPSRKTEPKQAKDTNAHMISLYDRLAKSASIWTLLGISRERADKILQNFQPGIFIVRLSGDKKTMVLSYRMQVRSQHVLIKVDLKKGFFLDGSLNVFRSVNHMIAHYMKHPIQNPDLCLNLPRALMEANETVHFQFFESLKIDFWTSKLAQKSIDEIWSKHVDNKTNTDTSIDEDDKGGPMLPPRHYLDTELNILQGLADIPDELNAYQEIPKKSPPEIQLQSKPPTVEKSPSNSVDPPEERKSKSVTKQPMLIVSNDIYGEVWISNSEDKQETVSERSIETEKIKFNGEVQNNVPKSLSDSLTNPGETKTRRKNIYKSVLERSIVTNEMKVVNLETKYADTKTQGNQNGALTTGTIPKIIEKYYPQLVFNDDNWRDLSSVCPSLTQEILQRNRLSIMVLEKERAELDTSISVSRVTEETTYNDQYVIPWDVKNSWLSDLIELNCSTNGTQDNASIGNSVYKDFKSCLNISQSLTENISLDNDRCVNDATELKVVSDDKDDVYEDGNRLQHEFLGAIESVMFSPSANKQFYWTNRINYGQSIRNFLIKLCSGNIRSEISKSIRLFIRCTLDRTDVSPYTTMRLIRQYMSGLKNLITKNKESFGLTRVINEEIKKTPQNVFINLDSIIESVLTRSVVKPLSINLNRLLVLEHYKNNNLKQISEGLEICKCMSMEKLGLKDDAKPIIDSKMEKIRHKFKELSSEYSPEKKIKSMVAIVDIVFNMVEEIYPTIDIDTITSNHILPLFVYVFSQCKLDAISMQCEVEYVEGLIWSSKLVNGEPGFFLLNLMSALEAIKVLAVPKLNPEDVINMCNPENTSHCSLSQAAVGSVNIIIMDEKINRMITKSIPVRSTVTVGSLCNTISHRLGVFNPRDYNLFSYDGHEETLLHDYESPLMIKILHQNKSGENIHFLYKRKNANFILPVQMP